jgi:predicted site-specific integrase-resolvase
LPSILEGTRFFDIPPSHRLVEPGAITTAEIGRRSGTGVCWNEGAREEANEWPPHKIRRYQPAQPAVAYVRMSTDHQKYSTENQLDRIRRFAAERGFEILRVFEDSGKSGLRLDGREALQTLMSEVASGCADFSAILVYDVSRWGRFRRRGCVP